MTKATSITPDGWPRGAGYAHATAATGRVVCLAGQIGWDPVTGVIAGTTVAGQAAVAFRNIALLLAAAGAAPADLVRLTWFVTDRDGYIDGRREIGRAWRDIFGAHYPAMSVVFVSALLEPGALVEIEATAIVPA